MIKRYTSPDMELVWTDEARLQTWLDVEIAVCEAWAQLGKIPQKALAQIKQKAAFDLNRVNAIEQEVHHDVIAFLMSVAEQVGEPARYIHLGLTSSDVLDTALALQLTRAGAIILDDVDHIIALLRQQSLRYKNTLMMGRTHGVHAEPITLGLKFALWYKELQRSRHRLEEAINEIAYGKISGAVGTFAHLEPKVEEQACKQLGLKPCPISSQIVQRDRHAQLMASIALLACSLDKFCVEIRGLHRTEIRELEEGFTEKQRGSSAMPHKKNPIICERVCGLARVIRSNLQAALENIPLWGERDISHSSCERIILPDTTILIDYMLRKFAGIIKNLRVYPENMERNLHISGDVFLSQKVLLKLVEKGLSRDDAYEIVQRVALESAENHANFIAVSYTHLRAHET